MKQVRRLPFFMSDTIIKQIEKVQKSGNKKNIRTFARNTTITAKMIGLVFDVHNGKGFVSVFITEDMIGYKLGEFVLTRKFKAHCGTKADKAKAATKGKK